MTRNLGLALGFVVALGLAPAADAQTTPYDAGVVESAHYGVPSLANQPYGGFGLEYSQPLTSGAVVMDQYGILHNVPSVPYVESAIPVAPVRTVVAARTSRSASPRAARQPRYQLTTGSLGQTGGNGVILYSPGMRQQGYGSGYGRGPYGVTDYSHMWMGWPIN